MKRKEIGLVQHKWKGGNTCSVCGLKRKPMALTKSLMILGYGTYAHLFLVDGEWINKRPDCIIPTTDN